DLVPDGPPVPVAFAPDTPLDEALATYAAAPEVEVLFESGNGGDPGAAAAATSQTFDTWPPSPTEPRSFQLAPGGQLVDGSASIGSADSARFTTDPAVSGDAYNVEGSDLATNTTSGWAEPSPTTNQSWISAPFATDTTFAGPVELDLW